MPETVLLTGASGYIAAHILDAFLGAGFHVRAQVRSKGSEERVKHHYTKYVDSGALSFVYVEDISVPGAFDEVVKDVEGVIHTASPFILNAKDYDKDLFDPARNGTLSILQAVKKNNPKVKRIVITSSFASAIDMSKGLRSGYTYTEADWNPMTIEEARNADPTSAYLVSKEIAEHAAYEFEEKEHPNFTVTTLLPPMVYGPVEHDVSSMSHLNTSAADVYRLMNGSEKSVPETGFYAYADVRDLAKAHLLAYTTEAAANQRYLITNASYTYQMLCDIIRKNFPELKDKTPEGDAGAPFPNVYHLDNSKSIEELGMTYRTMEESVVDMVKSLLALEKSLT
ncbi:NAD(P)-binding protein [Rhizodiscina lignyota]|uniref:NAD(P)-binding protein n=1 Tax=Rhizodiscina lignyota TaxID=1504668 RepID=A0A9P4I935_9PEZI|nr:NAD(P)-binding protein [Rhizodiscina lignyota]